jgi:hypothetical protein
MPAECGHCTWCETHTQVVLSKTPPSRPDPVRIAAVLEACGAGDDPRFLARIAFGISSPRVTVMKLGKHQVFGSMDECDFMVSRYPASGHCSSDDYEFDRNSDPIKSNLLSNESNKSDQTDQM